MGAPLQSRTTTSCSGRPGALLRRPPTAASTSATTCRAASMTEESWRAVLESHSGQPLAQAGNLVFTCCQRAHCMHKDAHCQAASLGAHRHSKAQPLGGCTSLWHLSTRLE